MSVIGQKGYDFLSPDPGGRNPLSTYLYRGKSTSIEWGNNSMIHIKLDDKFGLDTYQNRRDDIKSYDEMKKAGIIQSGGTILDIGAHWGTHSIYLRELIGNSGHIYSFEPNPDNTAVFKKTLQLNDYENISIIEKAASDSKGTTELKIPDQSSRSTVIDEDFSNKKSVQVPMISIDEFVKKNNIENIDFVKMDIQGAEVMAVNGMKECIDDINYMYIDYHAGKISDEDRDIFFNFLTKHGKIYKLNNKRQNLNPKNRITKSTELSEWMVILYRSQQIKE